MRNGVIYDVSHLNATWIEYKIESNKFPFFVSFSHHCFAKTVQGYNDCDSWKYHYPRDPRNFNEQRYKLSLDLLTIVKNLPTAITYHGHRESYAVCETKNDSGETVYYQVIFNVFRVHRKLRMHISSAYPLSKRPKIKKVRFFKIIKALTGGRPLPKP